MKTIIDIIAMINEFSWCCDCKRQCPYTVTNMGFCGLDTTYIAMDMLERGEY